MPSTDLSPFSVVPYSRDYLVEFVRFKTGWDRRSEVSKKQQLTYLCNYLEVDHIDAKTIVVENEYIDRHYLEDYSEYYARCFPSHPRQCSRLHFFRSEFSESQFLTALGSNDRAFGEHFLSGPSYLGFAVIRPIPHTILARVCLRPYSAFNNHPRDYRVITRKNEVSLFGFTLSVDAAPFIEQDKVVSACATSALWTIFSTCPEHMGVMAPSPSAITKAASHAAGAETRTFPTTGLTTVQVATTLKHYGLEPSKLLSDAKWSFNDLKESVFAFVTNDTPILLGGDVYQIDGSEGRVARLGLHLVCLLGYHIGPMEGTRDEGSIRAHRIDRYYGLISSASFETFNGLSSRTSLLLHSLPRYIWRCRIRVGDELLTDVLFDATEIPQGQVLIGYISYQLDGEILWRVVEADIAARKWDTFDTVPDNAKAHSSTFTRFFAGFRDKTWLNTAYGPLGLPRRPPKFGETDLYKNISLRSDAFIIRRGSGRTIAEWPLNTEKAYIWVVDELGDLVVGEDVAEEDGGFLGHPTLIDGKPARLGGELHFSQEKGVWLVNLKSRAYSAHILPGSAEEKEYLSHLLEKNFGPGPIEAEFPA